MLVFKKAQEILPGLLCALILAGFAVFLEGLLPYHLLNASIIGLFLGMVIHFFWKPTAVKKGLKFTSKRVLKFAIILLGASLSIEVILEVGKLSLTVMCFTLIACFGGGYLLGKALKLNWKLSSLISAGTGICGGSAIAAIAPVIEAEDKDIAYAMSATFLFDMAMILLFPLLGKWLHLSDMAYGLWAGTAVNDTSSVVAAGYAFSEVAGDFAVMVKLTRTISIIPVVIIFALIHRRIKQKQAGGKQKLSVDKSVFPWFILGFIALALCNSFGLISPEISVFAKNVSKFLLVTALTAIGLNTDFMEMKKSGPAPMLHGFLISTLVAVVALTVAFVIGIK